MARSLASVSSDDWMKGARIQKPSFRLYGQLDCRASEEKVLRFMRDGLPVKAWCRPFEKAAITVTTGRLPNAPRLYFFWSLCYHPSASTASEWCALPWVSGPPFWSFISLSSEQMQGSFDIV